MEKTSDIFLSRFSRQPENASAKQFDRLAAELGFASNGTDALLRVNVEAGQRYQEIESLLSEFVRSQSAKTAGPTDPLPAELSEYLADSQGPLAAIQIHLIERDLPLWEIDFERMSEVNYALPGFINVLNIQKLLLLSAIDDSQHGRTASMVQALEASWRLNQAIARRPDLVSQLLVSLTAEQQAGVLRQLEHLPKVWQNTWQDRFRQQSLLDTFSVTSGLQFDAWLHYRVLQRSLTPLLGGYLPSHQPASDVADAASSRGLMSRLFYWFSPAYYLSLRNINSNEASQRALSHLSELNFCQMTRSEVEKRLAQEKTAVWNTAVLPSEILARRWKDSGDRALAIELTEKILMAKQLARESSWPANLPNLNSNVCPSERWIYELKEDGTAAFYFSLQTNSKATVPLGYRLSSFSKSGGNR